MRGRYPALCLVLALVLTGCGKRQSVDQHAPASGPAAASAPAAVAPRGSAAEQKAAEQASDQPSKITRINEDGSETVEDVPSTATPDLETPSATPHKMHHRIVTPHGK